MIDDQSEPGAWAAELERLGTRAPTITPPGRGFLERFFRQRRENVGARLGVGDVRLTPAEQRTLIALFEATRDADRAQAGDHGG